MHYTVYVLYSPTRDKIYIGYTSNLIERFKSHQFLGKGWTARYRPWVVVYCEVFHTKKEAIDRETHFKQYRQRLKIRGLIQNEFSEKGYIEL